MPSNSKIQKGGGGEGKRKKLREFHVWRYETTNLVLLRVSVPPTHAHTFPQLTPINGKIIYFPLSTWNVALSPLQLFSFLGTL